MKRLNPKTGKIYKPGELRPDGLMFIKYTDELYTSGLLVGCNKEVWKRNPREYRSDILKLYEEGKLKKRRNPQTGSPFKKGERENNLYFIKYSFNFKKPETNFIGEIWSSFNSYLRHRFQKCLDKYRKKSKERGWECDLDTDYLIEIFPKNFICEVSGNKMIFGGNSFLNSPSLDRIDTQKGYIKGNVQWISFKSNSIKRTMSVKKLKYFHNLYLISMRNINKTKQQQMELFVSDQPTNLDKFLTVE